MPSAATKNALKTKASPKAEKKKRSSKSSESRDGALKRKKEEKTLRKKRSGELEGHVGDVPDTGGIGRSNATPRLLEPRPGWDTIFFFFFLTHVLITVLWHSQMILPAKLYPQCLRDLTKTYSKDWQDPLNFSQKTPVWYLSIIYCEVFFQLPFHFAAIYVFWTGSHYHPWFRFEAFSCYTWVRPHSRLFDRTPCFPICSTPFQLKLKAIIFHTEFRQLCIPYTSPQLSCQYLPFSLLLRRWPNVILPEVRF